MPCAQELGMDIGQFAGSIGLDPDNIDNLGEQMMGIMAAEMPADIEEGGENNFFQNLFGGFQKEDAPKKKKPKKKLLEGFGTNLTAKARAGEVDRVIGRDTEIMRCMEILNRRTKNNPCLIGEPGVGKTAIAEGLATRIVEGRVPAKLLDKEVFLLDFTAIVAGTQFRGQFEARLKNIIEEVKKQGNIILVIDELHNIVGAGDAEGAMSAANILKPALARGEIQVIGATTTSEYRKHIEKDAALERRFQPILIEEPTVEETIEIMRGIKSYYETYHKVVIDDNVICAAVNMSKRYITDRYLPDKAIDVIDEASSRANLKNEELVALTRLYKELEEVMKEKETATEAEGVEDYQHIADLTTRACRLEADIQEAESRAFDVRITIEDIAAVIERRTGIPAGQITKEETTRLLELEQVLKKRVKGQDEAIQIVASAIRRCRAGLTVRRHPVSFIFAGSTGVGKTELARALSEAMFDSEDALIRMDMSEYMEKHAVSKIIGSPPGYVGYDDAGQLTEKIRRRPYSVILLDEIEKANAEVLNVFLQVLEDGRITDSHGKVVSFENTVIIMTSNAGSDYKGTAPGYTATPEIANKDKTEKALRAFFKPEFLNRIDEIVLFNPLSRPVLMEILEKLLDEFATTLAEKCIGFRISEEAKELLLDLGLDEKNGARPLRRAISTHIADKVAHMLICSELKDGDVVSVTKGDDMKLYVQKA